MRTGERKRWASTASGLESELLVKIRNAPPPLSLSRSLACLFIRERVHKCGIVYGSTWNSWSLGMSTSKAFCIGGWHEMRWAARNKWYACPSNPRIPSAFQGRSRGVGGGLYGKSAASYIQQRLLVFAFTTPALRPCMNIWIIYVRVKNTH